ncbi:GNAT family N-acetyltransferase [Candidatus Gracilibacteria bacterium]|nr:GNAT family N-acetyltransferase [Candidatus Gracilibacteria bacterium]
MELQIDLYTEQHRAAVVDLSLRAWEPVFVSLEQVLGAMLFRALVPDWRISQQKAVEDVCAAAENHVWVALIADAVVGFVAVRLHPEDTLGEIYMIAVDPAAQGQGVGSALIGFALEWIRAAGMQVAMVETGGDPGHAPARHTYEKNGFALLPIARYYKLL